MQAVPSHFDQILHLKRRGGWGGSRSTTFSFLDGKTYRPYVTVDGHPEIREGMKVLVLLRKQDDWSSLAGWRDLETGVLTVGKPDAYRRALWLRFCVLVAVLFALWLGAPPSLMVGAVVLLSSGLWTSARELRRVEADLREIELLGMRGEA